MIRFLELYASAIMLLAYAACVLAAAGWLACGELRDWLEDRRSR